VRVVVALGGNALLRRGEPAEAETQRRNVLAAASALAEVAEEHELVVTHGNGPQVGLLALEADAYEAVAPYPVDVLGAETQGMIGYLLAQALQTELPAREVVAFLTQVVVDPVDPAFGRPTKPIGPVYDPGETRRLTEEQGWTVAPDGAYVRRVVASPQPYEILELRSIERLVSSGTIVICAGGGGVPVFREHERLRGAEAVIDKDLTAALLAEELDADVLAMVTDVPHVERAWRTPEAAPIEHATPGELRSLDFASGSMGPKIEAACRFVERRGGRAAIGALNEAAQVVAGIAGTQVTPARRADFPNRRPARLPMTRSAPAAKIPVR
jgi:carbamate kinase